MKTVSSIKKIAILISCFFLCLAHSQTLFQKSYSDLGIERGSCVIKTSDGGYLEGGTTGASGFDKYYIVKTDFAGSVQWSKTYGGSISEFLSSVIQTSDGGYILCGTTFSFNTQPYGDIWIIKTDASGNITWQNHYGYTGYDYGYSIQQTADGNYIIGGLTSSFGAGYYDYYIMKIDSMGNALWGTTIGGTGNDQAYTVLQTPDGEYMIAGQENSYAFTMTNPYNIMLCKLNAAGTLVWSKSYGGGNAGGNYICNSMRRTTDGGFVLVGWTDGVGSGLQDVYVLKVDSVGVFQWAKTFGGPNSDFGNDIRQTANGGYVIAGYTKSFGAGNDDAYIITTNASGNLNWSVCYGDTAIDRATSIDQTADGGFIIAGQTSATGASNSDFYLIKCDAAGFTGCQENDVTTLEQSPPPVVTTISPLVSSNALWLFTNATVGSGCVATTICSNVGIVTPSSEVKNSFLFPNPTSEVISFSKMLSGVEVYDVFGKLLVSEKGIVNAISVKDFPDGIYFARSGNSVEKFVVKH